MRGGYGLFWIPIDANWATNPHDRRPGQLESRPTITEISLPDIPATPSVLPGLTLLPHRDAASTSFQGALLGQGITIASPNFKYGYTQQWNLDLQRELPGGLFADIAYSGLKGTHLPQYSRQIDQLSGDNYLAQAAQQSAVSEDKVAIAQQVANPYVSVASPGSPLSSSTTLAGNLLRPFPQYSGVSYAGQGEFLQ